MITAIVLTKGVMKNVLPAWLNKHLMTVFPIPVRRPWSTGTARRFIGFSECLPLKMPSEILWPPWGTSFCEHSNFAGGVFGPKILLVTTSDITDRLETYRRLIQASKIATLGEMATGIAHELNLSLSDIKVDRATRIINHMRLFASKSDMDLVKVQINEILENAFEIFSQQLKLRGMDEIW